MVAEGEKEIRKRGVGIVVWAYQDKKSKEKAEQDFGGVDAG